MNPTGRAHGPFRHPGFEDADQADGIQRLTCASRSACLAIAAHSGWDAMTCIGCDAFVEMPRWDRYVETIELSAIGRLIASDELVRRTRDLEPGHELVRELLQRHPTMSISAISEKTGACRAYVAKVRRQLQEGGR